MNVSLILNVAQNSYLLAKGLRRLGVNAESYDDGGGYPLQTPYWEEADFAPEQTEGGFWDWLRIERADDGWRRPPWAKILGNDGAEPSYATQASYQADLGRLLRGQNILAPEPQQRRELLDALYHAIDWTPGDSSEVHVDLTVAEDALRLPAWRSVRTVAAEHDLTVLTGLAAHNGPFLPAETKWVTFEHATMRYVASLHNWGARLLAAAYQRAAANVITNADCWEAAGMLGVRHKSVFIPHPLDDQAFRPLRDGEATVRDQFQAALNCEFLFFAPARWSASEASGSKRNDRMLYAFKRYVDEAELAGAPRAGLICASWGSKDQVEAAQSLVSRIGLDGRVAWAPCLPKRRLQVWYRSVDVVLDQFADTVGSFGAVTAEALASGIPVITYLDWDRHDWCSRQGAQPVLPERPPVISARTTDDIYESMCWLAEMDPAERAAIGRRSRQWIARWHTLDRVALLHFCLYQRVLEGRPVQPWPPSSAELRDAASEAGLPIFDDEGNGFRVLDAVTAG